MDTSNDESRYINYLYSSRLYDQYTKKTHTFGSTNDIGHHHINHPTKKARSFFFLVLCRMMDRGVTHY